MFGVYVANLSVSMGMGGNGGSLQMKIVEDEANNVVLPRYDPVNRVLNGMIEDISGSGSYVFVPNPAFVDGDPFFGIDVYDDNNPLLAGLDDIQRAWLIKNSPSTGTACYFKYENLYFGGIFQRWTFSESVSGGRTYDIVLESPAKLLEGVQVIIENFNGATDLWANQFNINRFTEENPPGAGENPNYPYGFQDVNRWYDFSVNYPAPVGLSATPEVLPFHAAYGKINPPVGGTRPNRPNLWMHNIYNIFAYWENPIFGEAGPYMNFGNSRYNTSGLPVHKLLLGMEALMKIDAPENRIPQEPPNVGWNVFGGPMTFGTNDKPDEGPDSLDSNGTLLNEKPGTKFEFNLDEIVTFFDEEDIDFVQYRLKGPVKNVNGIFSELGEVFQFDYYYDVENYDPALRPDQLVDPDTGESINDGGRMEQAIIVLKVLSKRRPPEKHQIRNFVRAELELPRTERTLMSYSLGKELADTVTQKMVWGGKRTRYLKITNVLDQWAVWGRDDGRNSSYGKRKYNAVAPMRLLLQFPLASFPVFLDSLVNTELAGLYNVSAFELRMATGGKEPWQMFKTFQTLAQREPHGYNMFNAPWKAPIDITQGILQALSGGQRGNSYDAVLTNLQKAGGQWNQERNELGDKIFTAISSLAGEFYNQTFALLLPGEAPGVGYNIYEPTRYTDIVTDEDRDILDQDQNLIEEEFQILKSWEIADSAFDSLPLTYDIGAWDGVGKVTSLVSYPLRADCDYSTLGTDYNFGANLAGQNPNFSLFGQALVDEDLTNEITNAIEFPVVEPTGSIVSKKGSPDKESFFDYDGVFHGGFACVFKTGGAVKHYDVITTPDFGFGTLAQIFFGVSIPPINYIGSGKESLQFQIPPDVLLPNIFGVPQQSTRFHYGPWISLGRPHQEFVDENGGEIFYPHHPGGDPPGQEDPLDGTLRGVGFWNPNGRAEAIEDASLTPETFGSYKTLQQVGTLTAAIANTNMMESESGELKLAGAPAYNIGQRFTDLGPYVSNMTISVDATGGVTTTYKFNTWTPQFGKMAKYNIDRIAKITKNKFAFLKRRRDEVEQRPFPKIKFEKTDFKQLTKAQGSHQNNNALQMLFAGKFVQGNY